MTNAPSLSDIAEVVDIDKLEKVNLYLAAGWLWVEKYITDYGEPGKRRETVHYVLGWPGSLGAAQKPLTQDEREQHEEHERMIARFSNAQD